MGNGTLRTSGKAPLRAIRYPGDPPWLPWRWIRTLHEPGCAQGLPALFKAYRRVHSVLDVEKITSTILPRSDEEACRRCGQCCAQLLPEPVCKETFNRWKCSDNPVHLFHDPVTEGPRAGRSYTGWFHEGARLRICPLLLRDPATGDKFCVVYHLGPGQRPPACEGFKPNWPHCEVSQRPLVP